VDGASVSEATVHIGGFEDGDGDSGMPADANQALEDIQIHASKLASPMSPIDADVAGTVELVEAPVLPPPSELPITPATETADVKLDLEPQDQVGIGSSDTRVASPSASTTDKIAQLKQLASLVRDGILTEAEFQAEKAKVLNAESDSPSIASPRRSMSAAI